MSDAMYGVMFHHFCDARHPKGQGAITSEELEDILNYIGSERILPAHEWLDRAIRGTLKSWQTCLTFDDALRCQYDIAVPVLERYGLTAFWFVYSSVFEGKDEPLEIYRYFRTVEYPDIDQFYAEFEKEVQDTYPNEYAAGMDTFNAEEYLSGFSFYSHQDKVFRFLRDQVLGPERYDVIMGAMMRSRRFQVATIRDKLWMGNEHLKSLYCAGHIVGLHSYSHPTRLVDLSMTKQRDEYERNSDHLTSLLGVRPIAMSHPCNSYGSKTIQILKELGIEIGFCANMEQVTQRSHLEFPRMDHAHLLKAVTTKIDLGRSRRPAARQALSESSLPAIK